MEAGLHIIAGGGTDIVDYLSILTGKKCPITFNSNNGEGTMPTVEDVVFGEEYKLPSNGFTAPAGQSFKEWAKDNADGTKYAVGDSYTIEDATIFYAIWEQSTGTLPPSPSPSPSYPSITYDYFTITAAAGEGGSISPSGNISVREETDMTYTITPDSGYVIADVLVDGVSVGAVETYTFKAVQEVHTIEVKFVKESTEDSSGTTEELKLNKSYRKLRLRNKKTTDNTIKLKWRTVAGADGYVIYGNKCNSNGNVYKPEELKVIEKADKNTWTQKDLETGTYYKYYVKAYKLVNGEKVFFEKSKLIRVATTGGKYSNIKAVKVNEKAVTLKLGETFTIEATQVKKNKDKKVRKFKEIRFESSNNMIVAVNKEGVITAKGTGTCTIFVYAQNGVYKKVKVTVE